MKSATPLLLACFVLAAPAGAADHDVLRALVDRHIEPLMRQHDLPGMAVALTVDGKTAFFNYGLASKEAGTPVNERTLFELGSVSKTFAATLACHAQATGKLSLLDHPGKYLPALRGSPIDKATLLQLGAYTAGGLPQQFPDEVEGEAGALRYFQAWTPDAAPGTQRRYSNPSIGLFGHVTGLALGTSVADAFEQQLFPALGLRSTYVRVPAAAMASHAWGYDGKDQPVRSQPDVFDAQIHAVKSSSADMIRYLQQQIAPDKLAAPWRRALECTHAGHYRIGATVQGMGWEWYAAPVTQQVLVDGNSDRMSRQANPATALVPARQPERGALFNKTGSTRGFGAYVAFVPSRHVGIVMLANKFYPNAARVAAAHAILAGLGAADGTVSGNN